MRIESCEPRPKFVSYVESCAFKPSNTKHSIITHMHDEKFPYLQMLATEVDFGFLTPAQIASIYVVARSRPDDWETICAQPDALNYTPRAALVEDVNAYFNAAGEPLHDELHEMHQMFETFLRLSDAETGRTKSAPTKASAATVAFLAFARAFDATQIGSAFREHAALIERKQQAPPSEEACALIMRSFSAPWPKK